MWREMQSVCACRLPMHVACRGFCWIGLYLVLVLAPLFVLFMGQTPAGSGFLVDLSAAFGFAGAAMMAIMFVLTARFKRMTAPYGIDLIYYFHRQIAIVALVFIIAHPLLLVGADPRLLTVMRPSASPYHLDAGILSFVALLGLMATSLWRKQLKLHYDAWRIWHIILAAVAMALAIVHIHGVGHYVSSPLGIGVWSLIAVSCLLLLLYVRLFKPYWIQKHPYRVVELARERGDAWTVRLRPDGHQGFAFQPGQFAWLTLWNSPFALKEHPFSIASSAENRDEICFTIKELGDFTRRIGTLAAGETAYLDGPYGAFSVDRLAAPGFMFIAGGIGIAPIMSMLRTLADRGDSRPLVLVYAYNSWERLTFREELQDLGQRLRLKTVYVLNDPPPDWQGESGLLDDALLARCLPEERAGFEYLICGPTAMIEVAEKALHRAGIPLAKIHSELFDLV